MKSYLMYLWMMISVICTVSITGCGGGGGSSSSAGTAQAAITTTSDTFVKGITVTSRSASNPSGVEGVSCATNEVVVGGGCDCTGSASVNQDGELFSCHPVTNSFIGACYTQSAGQTVTPITVYALCMSATSASALITSVAPLANVDNMSTPTGLAKSAELLELEDKFRQMIEDNKKNLIK